MSTSNIDLRALKELAICDNSSVLSDHPADMSIVCRSDSLYLSGDISRCPGSTTACANAPESHGILSRALEKKATIYSQILDAISYHKVPLGLLCSFLDSLRINLDKIA